MSLAAIIPNNAREHAEIFYNGGILKEWLGSPPVITISLHNFGIAWLNDIFMCKEKEF